MITMCFLYNRPQQSGGKGMNENMDHRAVFNSHVCPPLEEERKLIYSSTDDIEASKTHVFTLKYF